MNPIKNPNNTISNPNAIYEYIHQQMYSNNDMYSELCQESSMYSKYTVCINSVTKMQCEVIDILEWATVCENIHSVKTVREVSSV